MIKTGNNERGSLFLVVAVLLAAAIAALAGISSGRVVYATRSQRVIERESRALNSAYAQIHLAMNVVNNSAYDAQNHNLVLQGAILGLNGGTVVNTTGGYVEGGTQSTATKAGETTGYATPTTGTTTTSTTAIEPVGKWLDSTKDPEYGLIPSTNVRVYHGRDYIKRLQRLKGETLTDVDPGGLSDSYYVLEAAGRVGDTIRLVSALVRENEPFSSFVFFQNRATLGVSGAPRGLIHSNEKLAFYFQGGNYVDSVSAVLGFDYLAGATVANTSLRDANPEAARIDLEQVDFAELKGKADLFTGRDGLDAEIKMFSSGKVRVKEYTPPRFDMVTRSYTYQKYTGFHYEPYTAQVKVQVGTKQVPYQKKIFDHYDFTPYQVTQKVKVGTKQVTKTKTVKVQVGTKQVTKYKTVKVQTGTKQVTKTKQEPVYEMQTVTKYKQVKKWVPFNDPGAGGGTSVGGGGAGALGEYVWVSEPYQTTEQVQVGTKTVTYTVTEPVYQLQQQAYTVTEPVYQLQQQTYTVTKNVYEWQTVTKTKKKKIYRYETAYKTEPVYELQDVTKQKRVNDYVPVTYTWQQEVWQAPVFQGKTFLSLSNSKGGTVYVDGRVTRLYGDLNGRMTLVGNEKVRVTGNIRYVDKNKNTAMKNGGDYLQPYVRNDKYLGNSVLGVIARDDVIMTRLMPSVAEINGTLMSVNGRVGIDGFWSDNTGELHKDSKKNRRKYLTKEQQQLERAYNRRGAYKTKRFTKNSLRRIGGIISNNRVMETYITTGKDGTSKVSAGFKRGNMKFDINLLFNPPPNFVEVPRPVLTTFVPIIMLRNRD